MSPLARTAHLAGCLIPTALLSSALLHEGRSGEDLATRADERADYDGRHLAAITDRGGASTRATIWDARTGAVVRRVDGHREAVRSVALAPGGRTVLTSSYMPNNPVGTLTKDDSIRLWEIATGRELLRLKDATQGRWSRDGRRILGFIRRPGRLPSAKRYDVAAWDARTGKRLFTARAPGEGAVPYHGLTLQEAARAPRLLLFQDFRAAVYDSRTGRPVSGELELSEQGDGFGFISPEGKTVHLATRSLVGVFSAEGTELVKTRFLSRGFSVVAWSPEGRRFARANPLGGDVESHDPGEGRAVLAPERLESPDSVVFSPDGASLAVNWGGVGGFPTHVRAYNARTAATLWDAEGRVVGYTRRGEAAVYDREGSRFSLRDGLTGRTLREVPLARAAGSGEPGR